MTDAARPSRRRHCGVAGPRRQLAARRLEHGPPAGGGTGPGWRGSQQPHEHVARGKAQHCARGQRGSEAGAGAVARSRRHRWAGAWGPGCELRVGKAFV